MQRDWDSAIRTLNRIVKADRDNASAWSDLGGAYLQAGEAGRAETALNRALALTPDAVPVLGNLANLKKQMGDAPAAAGFYRKILTQIPNSARAWEELARVKRFQAGDPDIDAMIKLLGAGGLNDEDRMYAEFALGKAHEDVGSYDQAFSHFAEANRLKRQTLPFDIQAHRAAVDGLIRIFDADFMGRHQGQGHADTRPVFVLGMPRSGTTLIEQILASHSAVVGAGELEIMSEVVAASIPAFPGGAAMLSGHNFDAIGRQYVNSLGAYGNKAQRITDKMPRNFLFIGLIAVALPDARIIHCRRSPLDTCFSCFTQHFPFGQEFSNDLTELGAYYQLYGRLIDHWHRVLPGRIFDVAYEDVIADPERQARRLIDFCGLAWEDACLNFHETKRQVATASAAQVREPIHARSVARWRRFAEHLGPLQNALGAYADNDG